MSKTNDLDLLDYYTRELDFLRKDGKNFAQRFPKVASRLDLRDSESLDPHTERLIESVAFLAVSLAVIFVSLASYDFLEDISLVM